MIRLLAIALLCLALPIHAALEEPEFPQFNFVFIIDTSISMASRKPAAVALVRELIATGFNHQIKEGDSIDIWTYDTKNHVDGFPPQIWEKAGAERIANGAAAYLEHAHFHGREKSISLKDDLGSLAPNTKGLMVLLITDGGELVSGLGFDDAINDQLPQLARKLTIPSQPFLISVSAVNGRFGDWHIFGGLGRPPLARLPRRERPVEVVQIAPQAKVSPPAFVQPEQKPMIFNFPPGAKINAPTPASEPPPRVVASAAPSEPARTEFKVNPPMSPAPAPAKTIVPESFAPAKTTAGSAAPPPVQKQATKVQPPAPAPPTVSPAAVKPVEATRQAAPQLNALLPKQPKAESAPVKQPIVEAAGGAGGPHSADTEMQRSVPAANAVKAGAGAGAGAASTTNTVAALAKSEFVLNPIYFATVGGGLLIVLGILLLLRKDKSKHQRSLISKSMDG
jgi:hypothetical protein